MTQLPEESIMKQLVLFALSAIATAAMAAGPAPASEILISGTSYQIASISGTSVRNEAYGAEAQAQQNLASNAGDVSISGNSLQAVVANGGSVYNRANANTTASQNLSSNVGEVTISGTSVQLTVLDRASIYNEAMGRDAKAVQNIASNNSCFVCGETTRGGGHGW
jgi:hypothetical protein